MPSTMVACVLKADNANMIFSIIMDVYAVGFIFYQVWFVVQLD